MKEYRIIDLTNVPINQMTGPVQEAADEGFEWVDVFERTERHFAVMARDKDSTPSATGPPGVF